MALNIKKECNVNLIKEISQKKDSIEKDIRNHVKIFYNSTSIISSCEIVYCNSNDFASCKVVLLAHLDQQSLIDPYVIYQAKHLRSLGKKIILCSANLLTELPQEKNIFDVIVCRTCAGNDFTSWKVCLELFPSLYKAEEITLCNDSVFGPFGSYKHIYDSMTAIKCDFWGITYSIEKIPHLQSYHIVCLKNTINSKAFKDFFNAVPFENNKDTKVKLELFFSLWLELHGLKCGCYRKLNSKISLLKHPTLMLDNGVPIVKRKVFKFSTWIRWQNDLKKYNYPLQLITNYFYRIGLDISTSLCPGLRSKTWPPSVFQFQECFSLSSKSSYSPLKIAIVFHCYYTETLYKIRPYLDAVPNYFHLLISTDTEEKFHIINTIISDLHLDKKIIRIVPNKGWDIGPFFNAFKDIIFEYDLICKLHAKTSTDLSSDNAQQWRDIIFDSLIGNKKRVEDIATLFYNYSELGMLIPPSPPFLVVKFGFNYGLCKNILKNMNLKVSKKEAIDFPVGAMFWARPLALKPLFDLDFNFNKFNSTNVFHRDGTLAHAIERCFLFSCCSAGFKWCRISPIPYNRILANPQK